MYSLAIRLTERGLSSRAMIYATDINDAALERAAEGTFAGERLASFESTYRAAGEMSPYGALFEPFAERERIYRLRPPRHA